MSEPCHECKHSHRQLTTIIHGMLWCDKLKVHTRPFRTMSCFVKRNDREGKEADTDRKIATTEDRLLVQSYPTAEELILAAAVLECATSCSFPEKQAGYRKVAAWLKSLAEE